MHNMEGPEVVYRALQDLCENRSSGSLLMFTDDGDGAGVVVTNGEITEVGYKWLRGSKALDRLCKISKCRTQFKSDVNIFLEDTYKKSHSFPDTRNILATIREQAAVDNVQHQRQPTVMIVDNSVLVRNRVAEVFQEQGFKTIKAFEGEMALNILRNNMPDIILVADILPGISGYETLDMIRSMPEYEKTPVLIIAPPSGRPEEITTIGGEQTEFLNKPLITEELVDVVLRYKENLG